MDDLKSPTPQQNIDNPTNPIPNVEILTPEECGILWRELSHNWFPQDAKDLIIRFYRRSQGMDIGKKEDKKNKGEG